MRSLIIGGFATLAAASPFYHGDFTGAPLDVTSSLVRRGDCSPQPAGATGAPSYTPQTAQGFSDSPAFAAAATGADVPQGYNEVFCNLNASNNAMQYMGYTTLQSYDVDQCAADCNNIEGCMSFNIYFERDPSEDPGAACPDPAAVTYVKCVFWGSIIDATTATNYGQYRDQFQVVIAGSNGYVNSALSSPDGCTGGMYLGNAAINPPAGSTVYLGETTFTTGEFSVDRCAEYCQDQAAYAEDHPPSDGSMPQTCAYFNTYELYINSTADPQGQACAIFSQALPASDATNYGQYRGNDHYIIGCSYAYSCPSCDDD